MAKVSPTVVDTSSSTNEAKESSTTNSQLKPEKEEGKYTYPRVERQSTRVKDLYTFFTFTKQLYIYIYIYIYSIFPSVYLNCIYSSSSIYIVVVVVLVVVVVVMK